MKTFLEDLDYIFLLNNHSFTELDVNSTGIIDEKKNIYISRCFKKEHYKVLTDPLTFEILFGYDFKYVFDLKSYDFFEGLILKNIGLFFEKSNSREKSLTLFSLAVSSLQSFIHSNWVFSNNLKAQMFFHNDETLNNWLMEEICIDGEFIHPLTKNISLLIIAKIIFHYLSQNVDLTLNTSRLWMVRTVWIFQQLLNERSPTFKSQMMTLLPLIEKDLSMGSIDDSNDIMLQFFVESVHILYFYYEPNLSKQALKSAIDVSKLSIELTGIMGKRTKFQSKDISQLSLQVKNSSDNQIVDLDKNLPKNIPLEDESLLNKMQPAEELSRDEIGYSKQALILAMCCYHKRNSEGHSSVIKEEIMAYIDFVLEQPQNVFVQTMALFLRSRWQNEGYRYLHRSVLQFEEIINQQKSLKYEEAFDYKFCVNLPPFWILQQELGTLYESMGSIDGALEVYERLNMYENMIKCHLLLSNKNKAECIIREQLAKQETAELYCYLGDVTRDEEHYLKSWQMSNGRYIKAQRSLAYLYLHNKRYKESLQFFEKSLEMNPLQISTWFSYGCASLSSCEYVKAATAFRRCVNLDSDNFEAWSNLATSFIRSGDKKRAFLTLQEAIKCSFDNWKLWENFLLVSVDTGHFEEGMQSYHRLLDLKQKHVDVQVLTIMVEAVVDNIVDANGCGSKNLIKKMLELFGRITSKTLNNADVWRLYSRLVSSNPEGELSVKEEKMLQYLQKSHRCLIADRGWETNVEECNSVVGRTIALANVYETQINKSESVEMKNKLISSAKLSINSFLLQIKKFHCDFVSGLLKQPIANSVEQLETIFRRIISMQQ